MSANAGISTNSQRYMGSSNLNIFIFLLFHSFTFLPFHGILLKTVILSRISSNSAMTATKAKGW